jgi:hypothetical protein
VWRCPWLVRVAGEERSLVAAWEVEKWEVTREGDS